MTPKIPTVPFWKFDLLCESLGLTPKGVTAIFGLRRETWNYWKRKGHLRQKYYDILEKSQGHPTKTRTMALNVVETVPFKDVAAYCKAAGISLKDAATRLGLTEGAGRYWKRSGRVPKQHLDALQLVPVAVPAEAENPSTKRHLLTRPDGITWRLSDPNEMFHFMATQLRMGQWTALIVLKDPTDPDQISIVKVP